MGYVRGIKTLGVDNQSFDANELLEEEARRRAVDGFNERPILDREGNEIARVREYSEGLLALLLKVPSFTMRKPFSRKRCFYRFLHLPLVGICTVSCLDVLQGCSSRWRSARQLTLSVGAAS
jgi:hypothetical protein